MNVRLDWSFGQEVRNADFRIYAIGLHLIGFVLVEKYTKLTDFRLNPPPKAIASFLQHTELRFTDIVRPGQ